MADTIEKRSTAAKITGPRPKLAISSYSVKKEGARQFWNAVTYWYSNVDQSMAGNEHYVVGLDLDAITWW